MSTRKQCVNVSSASYSGKENSPLHFGLSAEGYDLNTIMEGYDKLQWIVKIKNNRKVWVRHQVINKMVHEEPIIQHDTQDVTNIQNEDINEVQINDCNKVDEVNNISNNEILVDKTHKVVKPVKNSKPETLKAVVEEKKMTDYNIFLTYRLYELKKNNIDKTNNKELFNSVVQEWKELKTKPVELQNIMAVARQFNVIYKKK